MAPVTIVVLTWNALPYTRRCLETLRANTWHADCRVVVVDNGSTDGTVDYLKGLDFVSTIFNASNLGYSHANNQAIRAEEGRDIVLLNNDTEIHQPDWLERLQTAAYSSADTGVVGCRLVRPDGKLQHAGVFMPLETMWGQQIGAGELDVNQYHRVREVDSVVFACVYLKRDVLARVGLLDEGYFCYFEDTDFCVRAAAAGYRILCAGDVALLHHESTSTKVNAVPARTFFRPAQDRFRAKWADHLRTRYTREIGWHSLLNFTTGYAVSSTNLVTSLDRMGVEVSYRYVYGPGTVFPHPEPAEPGPPEVESIRRRKLKRNTPQVVYGQGDVLRCNFGAYKIGFSMLETSRIPENWARQANLMDEVWVPSRFNLETFRASGVVRPIHIIPLGVDPDHFHPGIASRPFAGLYTFLSIFEWGERKAPEILLRAFNEEFAADEPVVLFVKTTNLDPGLDVVREVANLDLDPRGGRIHLSLNQVVPTHQLGVLYRSADAFVLPTRGEGWGLPVIEAMACGLPVIVTDWSSHCDFMNAANAYPLPVEKMIPARAKCPYYKDSTWAQPSYTHLRSLMRHVFEHQTEARATGAKASREILSRWTSDHSAQRIIARLDAITGRKQSEPEASLSKGA